MSYHLIGIGGIGMSALARLLLQKNKSVQGSDLFSSSLTIEMEREGAQIAIGQAKRIDLKGKTVVYSSAILEDHIERKEARQIDAPLLHRFDLLMHLTQETKRLFVTGTHGKTTTTALLIEALQDASFALGGILKSSNTNAKWQDSPYFVLEADESDGSFLKGNAFGAIVTNLEKEHLDYWKTEESLKQGFAEFLQNVEKEELLFWCYDDPLLRHIAKRGTSYGFSLGADLQIISCKTALHGMEMDLLFEGKLYKGVRVPLFGEKNALNAAAVFGLALRLKVEESVLRQNLQNFQGVKRRLEYLGEVHKVLFFDDYAHHPTEIQATLEALKQRAFGRRIVALFQPHRYTRLQLHWEHFLEAFSLADLVLVVDVYRAGEEPIEGINSFSFVKQLQEKKAAQILSSFEEAASYLEPLDAFITLGAGSVTRAQVPIQETWAKCGKKLSVAVLCGGKSPEREISLKSKETFLQTLSETEYEKSLFILSQTGEWEFLGKKISYAEAVEKLVQCDVAIPVFHGPHGEDGMIQGFLETLGIPYVGSDTNASVCAMHKSWTKHVAVHHGVPTAPYLELKKGFPLSPFIEKGEEEIGYPMWVKAVHLGSSLGIMRAASRQELIKAIENAFSFDDVLIIEKEIRGRLIEFALLGNEEPLVAEPCEILNQGTFYDFEKKYGAQALGVEIPAQLTPLQKEIGSFLAKKMYLETGCKGLARIDFFLSEEGHFWFNEINPMPGFTPISGYPKMWEASGLKMESLIDELLAYALATKRMRI